MKDDKKNKIAKEHNRIDINDASEVEYAAKQFGVTPQVILETIGRVGDARSKIAAAIKRSNQS